MNVMITGADRPLGMLLLESLDGRYDVSGLSTGSETSPVSAGLPCVDLRSAEDLAPHLDGIDAVVHATEYDPNALSGSDAQQELLVRAARGTYVLLGEAVRAGVDRVVLASRLSLMDGYPAELVVDEMWKPRPDASAEGLAPHMAEIVCREYAREGNIRAVCLRFGDLDTPDGTQSGDAARSVVAALEIPFEAPGYRWHVCHVSSSPRFPMRAARKVLGLDDGGKAG